MAPPWLVSRPRNTFQRNRKSHMANMAPTMTALCR